MYEEYVDLREQIQAWIVAFRGALDTQDLRLIDDHRQRLGAALDALEQRA